MRDSLVPSHFGPFTDSSFRHDCITASFNERSTSRPQCSRRTLQAARCAAAAPIFCKGNTDAKSASKNDEILLGFIGTNSELFAWVRENEAKRSHLRTMLG